MPQETNADVFVWTGTEWAFDYPIRVGGTDQPVNPDLKPSYVDEFNLAFQQQLGSTMAVGVRGIYRKWHDIIDDIKIRRRKRRQDRARRATSRTTSSTASTRRFELTFNKPLLGPFPGRRQLHALGSHRQRRSLLGPGRSSLRSSSTTRTTSATVPAQLDGDGNVILPALSGPCPDILGHNRGGVLPWDVTHSVKLFTAYTYPFSFR